jgi:hypothetical protein
VDATYDAVWILPAASWKNYFRMFTVALLAALLLATSATGYPSTFTRFFGTTPIPDQWLAASPSRWVQPITSAAEEQWLGLLPTWQRMKADAVNNQVVPFVDEVATVRVLGGWDAKVGHCNASCDIIDAKMKFRWDLLDARLDPWVRHLNRSVLMVLDNIPYVLTGGTWVLGRFGQSAPPDDSSQFHWFVRRVIGHVQQRYGANRVAQRFRFRVGTEPNGPRYGNVSQYFAAYSAAARAIKLMSPQSEVGAGNWETGGKHNGGTFETAFYRLAKKANISVDFIAQSDYVPATRTPGGRRDPCTIRSGIRALQSYAALYGKPDTAVEVQEFSPLTNREHRDSVEPGSFGVSFYFACWTVALHSGARRIFHWGAANERGAHGAGNLWTGYGWAMGMADLLVGRPMVSVTLPTTCKRGVYSLSSDNVTLITAFDPFRGTPPTAVLNVVVPHDVAFVYTFNSTVSPYDQMLAEATKLSFTEYDDGLPYAMSHMLNAAGKRWVKKPAVWNRFMAMQRATFIAAPSSLKKGDTLVLPIFTSVVLLEHAMNVSS